MSFFNKNTANNLVKASREGNLPRVKEILEHGVDINSQDKRGFNALMAAAEFGHLKIVQFLLDQGANVQEKSKKYLMTPLHFATRGGQEEVVRLLLQKGAFVDPEDDDGNTPLMYAAYNNQLECLQHLIAAGADLKQRNKKGEDALTYATQRKAKTVASILTNALEHKHRLAQFEASVATDEWALMGAEKIVHTSVYPSMNRKLTDIFDLTNRERLLITTSLPDGHDSMTPPVSFDEISPAALKNAVEKFKQLGGAVDESFVLQGAQRLDKKSAPKLS